MHTCGGVTGTLGRLSIVRWRLVLLFGHCMCSANLQRHPGLALLNRVLVIERQSTPQELCNRFSSNGSCLFCLFLNAWHLRVQANELQWLLGCAGANTCHFERLGCSGGPMQGEEKRVANSGVHRCCQSKWRTNSSKRPVRRPLPSNTACSTDKHILQSKQNCGVLLQAASTA